MARPPTLVRPSHVMAPDTCRPAATICPAPTTQLLVFCLHSKVFEAEWAQGESNPSKVVVDEILS